MPQAPPHAFRTTGFGERKYSLITVGLSPHGICGKIFPFTLSKADKRIHLRIAQLPSPPQPLSIPKCPMPLSSKHQYRRLSGRGLDRLLLRSHVLSWLHTSGLPRPAHSPLTAGTQCTLLAEALSVCLTITLHAPPDGIRL